jgi:hypothetical protein
MPMITSFDMTTSNDQIFPKILNLKIDPQGGIFNRKLPIRNSMNMSSNDYREFISTFGFTLNWMKKWLNEVVWANGLTFPYNAK